MPDTCQLASQVQLASQALTCRLCLVAITVNINLHEGSAHFGDFSNLIVKLCYDAVKTRRYVHCSL
jgi:hypothetical protein